MRKEPRPGQERFGEGKCLEMYHPQLINGPYCWQDEQHAGSHQGQSVIWDEEPKVDVEVAEKFIELYRRIPNSNHEIWLNDDATVGMTMKGMADAVRFIRTGMSSDDY